MVRVVTWVRLKGSLAQELTVAMQRVLYALIFQITLWLRVAHE